MLPQTYRNVLTLFISFYKSFKKKHFFSVVHIIILG